MRWIFNVIKALLLLLVVLAGLAFLLPDHRQVERSREIAASPERIWSLIAEPRRWKAWSPWYAKDPAMTLRYSGADRGAGAEWHWDSPRQGRGHMRFDSADAPRRLAYTLVFEDLVTRATGEFRLEPVGQGTRVIWHLDAQLGHNPVMRWFGLALDGLLGRDFEAGLRHLEQVVTAR